MADQVPVHQMSSNKAESPPCQSARADVTGRAKSLGHATRRNHLSLAGPLSSHLDYDFRIHSTATQLSGRMHELAACLSSLYRNGLRSKGTAAGQSCLACTGRRGWVPSGTTPWKAGRGPTGSPFPQTFAGRLQVSAKDQPSRCDVHKGKTAPTMFRTNTTPPRALAE